jgi:phage repressor protein C with HTH and peptisase S24 domain
MNSLSTSFDERRWFHCVTMSLKLVRIDRLKQFQKSRNVGVVELGQLIGRKTNQTSDLLNGRASFGEKVARSIEEAAHLPVGWLDQADESLVPIAAEPPAVYASTEDLVIPQYRTGGAMGAGVLLRDQPGVINSWHVSPEWIQKNVHHVTSPKNLAIVTGFGDSMKPMYNPGDPLLVDTGVKSVEFDGVYFFRIGEEGFIKRLQRVPGEGLLAISENKAYRDWTIRDGMDFEVFARVVKVWRGDDY